MSIKSITISIGFRKFQSCQKIKWNGKQQEYQEVNSKRRKNNTGVGDDVQTERQTQIGNSTEIFLGVHLRASNKSGLDFGIAHSARKRTRLLRYERYTYGERRSRILRRKGI